MHEKFVSQTLLPHPRIGVTSADDPAPDNYVTAVKRTGGMPVVLANAVADIDAMLNGLDGLLVTGGSDIDPKQYGETEHIATQPGDPARDAFELLIVQAACERGIPTLAICRGLQIANVAWGGSLHQHIPDLVAGQVIHDDQSRKFETFPEHVVQVEEDSLLFRTIGRLRFATNASHHQAADRVGDGLRVVGRTDDGIIEALERPGAASFWLATQWHPERLLDSDDGRSMRIFDAFIKAARSVVTASKLPA